jgi:hypothetical protein
MTRKINTTKQARSLHLVAKWMGEHGMTEDGSPAPTGRDAAHSGLGPQLIADWDWPSSGPTPTVLLEGGPEDWALRVSGELADEFDRIGVFAEPYAGWALCLYPA